MASVSVAAQMLPPERKHENDEQLEVLGMRVCPKEPGGAVGRASRLQLAQSQKVLLGSAVHAAHCPELPSAPHSRHHRCSVSTIIGVWSELLMTFKVLTYYV